MLDMPININKGNNMNTKTNCWFENNNKIVPKLNEQYILKKDLSWESVTFLMV